MELNFDSLFKSSTWALNIARIHPNIKRDRVWLLQILFRFTFMIPVQCLVMYNIINHDLKQGNILQASKNGVLAIAIQMAMVQFFILVFNQNAVLNLIKDMNKDYKISKNLTPDEQAIIKKYIHLGQRVCKQWSVQAFLCTFQYILKNVFLQLYYYCVGNDGGNRLIPLYDLTYPTSLIQDNKDKYSVHLFTYFLLTMYGASASVVYAAYVPLGPIMMLHACAQLEIAQSRIDKLFVELDDDIIKEKLKGIIELLQYIYSFVDRITAVFNFAYEVTLKLTALILPVTLFAFIEVAKDGEISNELIVFMIGSVLISFTPCYYSELLQGKGEDLRIALYSCGWERHYNRSSRKTLLIMLQYALRPIAIKTLFRTLCLDALTDLFQQSYGIFNLMNAMSE